jgi:hypothetical protein
MIDAKIRTTPYKFCFFELSPIVCEDPLGYVEPLYDTLQKFDRCVLCDVHHWHDFHPFGEHINNDK